jgi:hypothetical protein
MGYFPHVASNGICHISFVVLLSAKLITIGNYLLLGRSCLHLLQIHFRQQIEAFRQFAAAAKVILLLVSLRLICEALAMALNVATNPSLHSGVFVHSLPTITSPRLSQLYTTIKLQTEII